MAADDWLVVDSEDEELDSSKQTHPTMFGDLASLDASTIQTDIFSLYRPRTPPREPLENGSLFTPPPETRVDSTVDNFTSAPSTADVPSVVLPKQRPKPRLVMKKAKNPDQNIDVASTSFSHISDPPISATRRTIDTIISAPSAPSRLSDAVEDVYSSLDIAERAKMRSRKSQTAKKLVPPSYEMNEVIELTSDEDELTLKPTKRQKKRANPAPKLDSAPKPRPKPTLQVKPKAVPPSGSPGPTVVPDSQAPHTQQAFSSQLPASTLPTVPPSTPPQAREPTPDSSPPVTNRKRKRARPSAVEDIDEIDIIDGNSTRISPSFSEPPLFFAPSSSVPTDSGVEIPPVEPLGARGKKKQIPSKKGTQTNTRKKGRKGKVETASVVEETIEESEKIVQEPSTSTNYSSNPAKERHSSGVKNTMIGKVPGSKERIEDTTMDSCEEDELIPPSRFETAHTPPTGEREQRSKENLRPADSSPRRRDLPLEHTSTSRIQVRGSLVKPKTTPMIELIRRVNSQPNSPFPNASRTYSPLLKSSRTMLSKIAPLHPNRRTPPPPPPRPPPPKKSKKQLEMEERIEEELAETIEGWSCLTDEERKSLRKARIDAELGYE